jgi:iron complex outermembrane receptor protein
MTATSPPADPWLPAACQRRGRRALALGLVLAASVSAPQRAAADDLTSMSLEQLLDVTIIGASKYEQRQADVAAAVSVITRQEIKAYGWRTIDEALASLPGVHTTYDRQYKYLGVRGFSLPGDFSTRVLVMLDGNRVNNPGYDGGPVGQEFPVGIDLIERVEFIPGPGGAVYGQNAMFAVINVITRRGADLDGTELSASYGHPQARRERTASWGKVLDSGIDILLSASAMRSRGENHELDFGAAGLAGVASGLDGESDSKLLARVSSGPWFFQFALGDRRKDDPTGGYHSDPLVPGQYQADRYVLTQLQYRQALAGDTVQVYARMFAGQERYTSILSYGTPLLFLQPSDWHGAELRLLSTVLADHKLMCGLEAQRNVRNGQSVLDLAEPANDLHIPGSGYRVGLYAQDEWHLAHTLTATVGMRLDRNNATGTASSPRAALIWQASPATTFKAMVGRAHRAPNFFEHDYYDGVSQVANPALKGETIETLELFADHRIGRDLTLRASAYQWTMKDLVTQGTDPLTGLLQFQSGQTARARGLELSADQVWPSGARLRANASLQSAAYESGAGLTNSPKLLARINLSGPLPSAALRMGYELRYDGPRLSLEGTRIGGDAVSNLHISTDALIKGAEIALSLDNLFAKRYAQPGSKGNWQDAIAQDGRSVRVSLGLVF